MARQLLGLQIHSYETRIGKPINVFFHAVFLDAWKRAGVDEEFRDVKRDLPARKLLLISHDFQIIESHVEIHEARMHQPPMRRVLADDVHRAIRGAMVNHHPKIKDGKVMLEPPRQ